jgi:hypothetical protein
MDEKKRQKNAKNFVCEFCNFKCCKNSEWERHLFTTKHEKNEKRYKMIQFFDKKTPKNSLETTACMCGKTYKHYSGLWRHKKICDFKSEPIKPDNEEPFHEIKLLTTLITDLVKSNTELQKSVLEVCKNGTNVTNNTITHNKTFNLNVFLNEQCKDAMNIMDFVDSLKLQVSDLENVGKVGFVSGISNIIVKHLKAMDIHKRPVHCSDSKREVMYVKDENKWEKENDEKKKLKKAIKYIAHKNSKMLPEFKAKYPDCIYSDSNKSDQYNKIIIEAMGGCGDNDDEKEDKIIKNIAREVIIDKNEL